MTARIKAEDLLPETRNKLKIGLPNVQLKIVALGKVLQDLQNLTNREALWVLRTSINHIKGYREKGTRA
jgi:hypothetical protein